MTPCLPAVTLLGALVLPPHVGSPGDRRLALGAGVEGQQPAADVRVGVFPFLSLMLEGVWHEDAPLVGGQIRAAAGRTRGDLYASAWVEGHVRPVLTTEVTRTVAGGDVGLGLGVTVVLDWASLALDGGVALGMPVLDVELGRGVADTAIDQQGGLFALQRVTFGVDLGDHFEIAARGSFGLPIDSVRFNRRNQDVLGEWDTRLGLRALVRFF